MRMRTAAALAAVGWALSASVASAADVDGLRVNGRAESPLLGIDDTKPAFSWKVHGTDAQTAYQVRAASSDAKLAAPDLWDSGKVDSANSTQIAYQGAALGSRQAVSWQVRVWGEDGTASGWSAPARFELGLLEPADWGPARWIDYPERTDDQALPLFARAFGVPAGKTVSRARLYVSSLGIGVHTVNGKPVTDEVLAPGNTNEQQAVEYRAYDIAPLLASGSNTLGVQLGNGTAYSRRTPNPAAQRTNPYARWISDPVGPVTATSAVAPGDENVRVSSTTGFAAGQTINLDTGNAGLALESRTITNVGTPATTTQLLLPAAAGATNLKLASVANFTAGDRVTVGGEQVTVTEVGTAGTPTTLFEPVAAGATNIKVASTTGFVAGQQAIVDGELRTVATVGTQGRATTLSAAAAAGATNVKVASVAGLIADSQLTIDGETVTVTAVGTQGANGTGLTLAAPLAAAHPSGSAVRYSGTGITLDAALASAHAAGAPARGVGTGLTVTALSAAHATGENVSTPGTGITFTPAAAGTHAAGFRITRSGSITAAHTSVSPRLLARLELTYTDGTSNTIVSDRDWRTALGPTTSDNWYSGSDYDARREQPGWDGPNADLTASAKRRDGSATGWTDPGFAPPPNLNTKLRWREAEPIEVVDTITATKVTQIQPGTWRFDLPQAASGFMRVKLPATLPAGTQVRMQIGESLLPDGNIELLDIVEGDPATGRQTFDSYTMWGNPNGETWSPQFNYDGFQYIVMTGLPDGFTPSPEMISNLQTSATPPSAGRLTTDNERINRIHRMSRYSIMSNMQSIFTDCPNREKAGWLADMIQSMPAIDKHFEMAAYLRNMQRQMEEAQHKTGIDTGFLAATVPNDENWATGFGNDINWNGAIVLTPYTLYKNYGDTETMATYWDSMELFMGYIANRRVSGQTGDARYFVDNGLGDWAAGDRSTPRAVTATSGYFLLATHMAEMAEVLGKSEDRETYAALAANIKRVYNDRFFNPTLHRYATNPTSSVSTQAGQGIPLDYGLVPEGEEQNVLDALVQLVYDYHPFGGGPHTSGGTVGLGPIVRALQDGGRDDVLWDMLQEDTRPSYGYFIQPSVKHPNGLTTIPEYWDLAQSQNHMILLQTDEWFTTGLAGIQQAEDSVAYKRLVIKPRTVGTLRHVRGVYNSPYGEVVSEWRKNPDGSLATLDVTVPPGSTARVYVPSAGSIVAQGDGDATYVGLQDGHQVFDVEAGTTSFRHGTSVPGDVGGTVPPTLSLTLGAPASFGAFTPGAERTYEASTTANVVSTAGNAALSVSEPGHLRNGAFELPEPLQVAVSKSSWTAPVSNDPVSVTFRQRIKADDPLRTGEYRRTLTFTLSTTAP